MIKKLYVNPITAHLWAISINNTVCKCICNDHYSLLTNATHASDDHFFLLKFITNKPSLWKIQELTFLDGQWLFELVMEGNLSNEFE